MFGAWTHAADCALGCGTSVRDATPHCLQLEPSNVAPSEMRGGPDVSIAAPVTIDTTSCTATGVIAATAFRVVDGYCVLSVASFRIEAGQQTEVVGSRPLIVLSTGDVSIVGNLAAVGRNTTVAGPGESPMGAGADGEPTGANDGGGGGGSFCGAGGAGGDGGAAGAAGTAVAASLLSPLRGGSPGGRGSGATDLRGAGGRGGGAIQISSRGALTITGILYATGGAGGGGRRDQIRRTAAGAGGAGSGGGILLEAATIAFVGSAHLDVRGGGGGSGACFDDTYSADEQGQNGQEGYEGANTRPLGGAAPTCELTSVFTAGAGGDGSGVDRIDALVGGNGDNAGGGGGGAGCVALRAASIPVVPTWPASPGLLASAPPLAD
ncbi:MAG: hypothetical protein K1X94_26025 [Sandaracinaceae bacterium]|nr:hypothetical protein [Sandaracinaceae bacterium]